MTSVLGPEWHLSADGINTLTENGTIKDYNKILTLALNTDLKEIGSPVLVNELNNERTSKIVLQIQKIRNVSAPKANEESQAAPRMLKLNLTDGDSHVQALEISAINSISRERTAPGTKILLNNAKISSGYILLDSKSCTVLGGRVPHLYEKWEIAKSIQRNKRRTSSNDDGPPPWVNFGTKIQTGNQENDFKSLGNKNKEANKDSSEFELQRQGAIAEASGAIKKVFGGRVKQNVQPVANNNQKDRQDKIKAKSKFTQKERDVEEKPLKPSAKVSLFAYLEVKLPLSDNQNTANNATAIETHSYPNNPVNTNKFGETYGKLQSSSQNEYQNNYSQQNKRDYKQSNYNRNDKAPAQAIKNDQPTNSYSKQYNKPNVTSTNSLKRYEKPPPQQQRRYEEDSTNGNKTYQGSSNSNSIQKDKQVNDLANNLNKLSLNSQFATRSLRQHLNLGPARKSEEPAKKPEVTQNIVWNIGDECMAKYWEDGKFYNAVITAITDKTYAVKFKGYGNIEEVLKTDCLPVTGNFNKQNYSNQNQQNRRSDQPKPYSGSMEFRRSTRNYK